MPRPRLDTATVHTELRAHGVEPTFETYLGPNQRLAFRCACPERRPGAITFRALHYQHVRPLCPTCRLAQQQARMRANRQDRPARPPETIATTTTATRRALITRRVADLFGEHGVTPLDTYQDGTTPLRFVCAGPCGGAVHSIVPSALQKGQIPRCPSCQAAARPRSNAHYRFNPDRTDAERAKVRTAADRRWERAVRDAHHDTCVVTGRRGTAPHHLYGYDTHPLLRLVLQNGVLLTHRLHREFHDIYGYGANTYSQFIEFYETLTGRSCPIPDPLSRDQLQIY